jgi:hypothetical protein
MNSRERLEYEDKNVFKIKLLKLLSRNKYFQHHYCVLFQLYQYMYIHIVSLSFLFNKNEKLLFLIVTSKEGLKTSL